MAGSTPTPVRAFTCPQCGAAVHIFAAGLTVTVVCSACATPIDAVDNNYRILATAQSIKAKLLIPMGRIGTLLGKRYQVIGWLLREDVDSGFQWAEYLLFNPYYGFCWLIESAGHWSIATPLRDPITAMQRARPDADWQRFSAGQARTVQMLGELYWRAAVGDTVHMTDYIAPPCMMSREADGREINWSLSTYVNAEMLREAFRVGVPWPAKNRIAAHQPNVAQTQARSMSRLFALFAIILLFTQMVLVSRATNNIVYDAAASVEETIPLELRGSGNVMVTLSQTQLDNAWSDIQVELANTQTGQTRNAAVELSYYHGLDDGEPWAEDERTTTVNFSGVDAGQYALRMDADTSARDKTYHVQVRRNAPVWAPFIIALLILGGAVAVRVQAASYFERWRWYDATDAPGTFLALAERGKGPA